MNDTFVKEGFGSLAKASGAKPRSNGESLMANCLHSKLKAQDACPEEAAPGSGVLSTAMASRMMLTNLNVLVPVPVEPNVQRGRLGAVRWMLGAGGTGHPRVSRELRIRGARQLSAP
jgi:hypothetical protein